MNTPTMWVLGGLALLAIARDANAQNANYVTENGVTYQVYRQQKSIPVTTYQDQTSKTYQPLTTTQYQAYPQTYYSPVTQYQWVAKYRNWWNPFGRPYWTTELEPVTRWQAQQTTVHVPVSKTEWVEHTHTAKVPVTTYQTVEDEHRVAVSVAPNAAGTAIASRPINGTYGGQQLDSDPPRSSGSYR